MTNNDPGSIPNRWLNCPRKSDNIISEKFFAFKTPLSMKFRDKVPIECIFTPEMIFGYVKTINLKLGLWIDLTNTSRYYDREIIEKNGAKYIKLKCRGHGETPSADQTKSFISIVEEFMNDRPFDIIGVHCTHGFNRTGFLIVSYLVEKLDCSVEAALNLFAQSRPPGIYKADYIKELYRRYGDEEEAPAPPDMPNWCSEYDDHASGSNFNNVVNNYASSRNRDVSNTASTSNDIDEDDAIIENENIDHDGNDRNSGIGNEKESGTDGQPPKKKRKREMVKKDAKFMSGVSGVTLFLEQPKLGDLKQKVQDMCGWKSMGFPGSQPVSMDQNNIRNLHNMPYRVSWKADGTRYMMLINCRDEVYFFDRDFSCFQVDKLTFPKRKNLHEHISDTLLDGEMVIDKVNHEFIPRYLVYDIIKFENDDIGQMPFYPDRIECIKKEIVGPRYEAFGRNVVNRSTESFSLRDKEFWGIRLASYLLSPKFSSKLCHEPDGLIFQPSKENYNPGQSPNVLKWKPLNMNSIDFLLKITTESGPGIVPQKIGLLFVADSPGEFGKIKYTKQLKELNNKIIECSYENGQYVFMRQRTDKSFPNNYNTASSVLTSIRRPVTTEMLLDFITKYRFKDDNEIMPPPQGQQVK